MPAEPGFIGQLRGAQSVTEALRAGRSLGLVLVRAGAAGPALREALELARARGVSVREVSPGVLRRMTSIGPASDVLALVGRSPEGGLDDVAARGGALWLLTGVAYPTNAGVAIRTAEGSGAAGIVIDADWDHVGRRAALRASMRADWYMPVLWEKAELAIESARAAGRRIFGIENSGVRGPWDADLTVPCLFIVGGEARGIPAGILEDCDEVLRVPMAGFIPSYNLQIPLGVVATERLRQLDVGLSGGERKLQR